MVERQGDQEVRMTNLNGQDLKAVAVDAAATEILERFVEEVFARADFDRQFPETDRADELVVGRIFDQGTGSTAQQRVAQDEPQQGVRVEKEPHYMYSAKSFKCSSSSWIIVKLP